MRFPSCRLLWLVWGILLLGCERQPDQPPQHVQNPIQTEQPRPTTQQLLSGPYVRLRLPGMPLSLQVPPEWKISFMNTLALLEGPTPFDRAAIQLSHRDPLREDQIELLVAGVRKKHQDRPSPINDFKFKKLSGMNVLEELSSSEPIITPKVDAWGQNMLDPNGNPITTTITPVHWKLTVFVPGDKAFNQYELNFIDLTTDQYAVDKEFLRKIVDSLEYERAQPSADAP